MALFTELHNYMIEHHPGMVLEGDMVLYSESTLRAIMPKNIKKAGDHDKQMHGCQTYIISKNIYACVKMWRKKFVARERATINARARCREKVLKQERLDTIL